MKKRVIAVLIGMILILSMLPAGAFESSPFFYEEKDGNLIVTGYAETTGYLSIPSRIDGATVTGIGSFAFAFGSYRGISIPYSITIIGSGAFMGCEGVKSVTIPENVINIGDNAFYGCSSLSSAEISPSVEYIGLDVFYGCSEELVIKGYDGTVAEEYALEYGYEFISLGEAEDLSVASGKCGEDAFWKLSKGGTLTIYGKGETLAGENGEVPWYEYKDLVKAVKVSEGITSILPGAFREMTALEGVNLPEGLITIGERAFEKCNRIRAIEIPETVKTIGSVAFSNADSLQKIIIPSSVETIGSNVFENCDDLKVVKISEGVSQIGNYCFMNCGDLYSVTIPETLESIPSGCFSSCKSLENITIPEGVKSIYYSAFSSCPINEVTIPVTVTSIYDNAFDSTVVIKGYDGSAAESYAEKNGNGFLSLGIAPDMILVSGTWKDNVNWSIDTNMVLTISGTGEVESVSSYSDYPWYGEGYSSIVIKEGITVLADYMFYNTPATKITFPGSLETIGMYAFATSKYLEKVVIPEGVNEIGICAFRSCNSLSEVHIPSSVIMMRTDLYPFDRCPASLTLYVYEGTIGEYAAQLKGTNYVSAPLGEEKVVLEKKYDDNISWSVTNKRKLTVWADAPGALPGYTQFPWRSLKGISGVCVGENITAIEEYAFYELKELKEIEFSEYVTLIEKTAFGTISGTPVVKAYSGSAGEEFANNEGYSFVSLGEAPTVIIAKGNYEYSEGGWTIDSLGVLTLGGKGVIEDWNIPWPSDYNNMIKKVVISEGVTYINYGLFYRLEKLTEAVLPASFIMVNEALFTGTTVIYGYSGSRAESWAEEFGYTFVSLGEIPDMVIAEGSSGNDTYYTLSSKGVLTIGGNGYVSNIPWMQFSDYVKKIVVEAGITGLTSNAFSEMENLTEAEFSQDMQVTSMSNVFYECNALTNVVLPPVETLGSYFFQNCEGIRKIEIPETVTTISYGAVYGCWNLEEVIIPPSVTTINRGFYNCGAGFKITGYNGTKAQQYANSNGIVFNSLGNIALKDPITGSYDNFEWVIDTDGTFTVTGEGELDPGHATYAPWYDKKNYVEKVVIGEGVTFIGSYLFSGYESLESVELSSTVTTVGSGAFACCYALKDVKLNEGLKVIDSWAFESCSSLEKIYIPQSVTYIDYAFYAMSDNFAIEGYLNSTAHQYAEKNGYDFISLGEMQREVVETGEAGSFITWELDNFGNLTFSGYGAMNDYYNGDAPWREYNVKSVEIGEGIISIGARAFNEMPTIKKITIAEGVERIEAGAFANCWEAERIIVPDSVWLIGEEAFMNCWRGVVTGGSVEIVGVGAFSGIRVYGVSGGAVEAYASEYGDCTFLPVVSEGKCGDAVFWRFSILDETLTIEGVGRMYDYPDIDWEGSAPWYPFRGDIKKVEMKDGITYLGEGSFHYLMATEITLPSTLEEIGVSALGYAMFEEVIIPDGCIKINAWAFDCSENLKKVVIPASVGEIGNGAFADCYDLVLYVYEGSYGYEYAIGMELPFECMMPAPVLYDVYGLKYGDTIVVIAEGNYLDGYTAYARVTDESGSFRGFVILESGPMGLMGEITCPQGAEVKCFIWNSLEDMNPVCSAKSGLVYDMEE